MIQDVKPAPPKIPEFVQTGAGWTQIAGFTAFQIGQAAAYLAAGI